LKRRFQINKILKIAKTRLTEF